MARILLMLLAAFLIFAPSAKAQNHIHNAAFDHNVSGWNAPIPLAHDAADGFAAPGAAQTIGLAQQPGFPPQAGIFQCVDLAGLAPSDRLDVHAAIKPVDYMASEIQLLVTFYSGSPSCDPGAQLDTAFVPAFVISGPGEWTFVEGAVFANFVAGQAASARILPLVTASDTADPLAALTRFDDVFLGFLPLFVDDFESGDISKWSPFP